MVGVVIVTHADMAAGLVNAMRMILGELENVLAVQINPGDGVESLMVGVQEAITGTDTGDGVLVLVDLVGASPFNVSARIAVSHADIGVITGVNLPMLAEVLVQREGRTLEQLTRIAKEAGKGGIAVLKEMLDS